MPQKTYPGQHKFRIVQNNEAKQANRRAYVRKQMANLRQKHLKERHDNYVIAEEIMSELAMERYVLIKYLKRFTTFTNI